jgi:hypothetical protein
VSAASERTCSGRERLSASLAQQAAHPLKPSWLVTEEAIAESWVSGPATEAVLSR